MAATAGGAALRAAAARVLHAVRVDGRSLDAALAAAEQTVADGDRSFLRHLGYEALRHHFSLRATLASLLDRPLKRRDSVIEDLLVVGLAQLAHSRVKSHSAVTLSVDAARELGRPGLAGLVNGVLRRYLRSPPAITGDEAVAEHPRWMLERLAADWPEDAPAIIAANNARAPMWLRVNARRATPAAYRERLAVAADAGEAEPRSGLDAALCLAEPRPVDALPGFADGDVSVQDGAAQLAAPWLLAGGGERRILDACAAPGGKTGHLAELAAAGTSLTAIDSDSHRVGLVSETMARLGGVATVVAGDASNPETWWDREPYDRILVDAPCSASGVIRRHPDIRVLRRESDLAALAARQAAILDALWPLLARGGRLLYVTCSVFAAENDAVIGAFLGRLRDAREELLLPNNNIRDVMRRKACGWQLLPGTCNLDGFYFACLTRD